jgi:putative NADH-flavin reductase
MKLVVVGATGGTGLEIIHQSVERGHSVTAFVRSPRALTRFRDRLSIVQGDLLSGNELARVIEGHDAVLSAFGPRVPVSEADATLLRRFAAALTDGMSRAGVWRVVVESVAFLFKDSILPPVYLLGRLFFPRTVADSSAMESIFEESELDWTMVRPPELTNGAYTGKYRVREGRLPRFGFRVSRADVADYMIAAAENHFCSRKIVGVSN